VIAAGSRGPGQVIGPSALAVDTAGTLYLADYNNGWGIQKRDAQGNWSVVATQGSAPGGQTGCRMW
jgi:hypothetical protein